mmetsp:Transcript_15608/g.29813  ORF Transcript_15608/g.29813 Transcript_15608/m.29813 type:complete len:275 (-) Transcript_15608:269-1093(-)
MPKEITSTSIARSQYLILLPFIFSATKCIRFSFRVDSRWCVRGRTNYNRVSVTYGDTSSKVGIVRPVACPYLAVKLPGCTIEMIDRSTPNSFVRICPRCSNHHGITSDSHTRTKPSLRISSTHKILLLLERCALESVDKDTIRATFSNGNSIVIDGHTMPINALIRAAEAQLLLVPRNTVKAKNIGASTKVFIVRSHNDGVTIDGHTVTKTIRAGSVARRNHRFVRPGRSIIGVNVCSSTAFPGGPNDQNIATQGNIPAEARGPQDVPLAIVLD